MVIIVMIRAATRRERGFGRGRHAVFGDVGGGLRRGCGPEPRLLHPVS